MERPGWPPARADDPERPERAEPAGDGWVVEGAAPARRPSEVRWTQRREAGAWPDGPRPEGSQPDWPDPGGGEPEPRDDWERGPHEGVDLLLGQLQGGYMGSVTQTIDLAMLQRLLAEEEGRRGRRGGQPGRGGAPAEPDGTQALRMRPRGGGRPGVPEGADSTALLARHRAGTEPPAARARADRDPPADRPQAGAHPPAARGRDDPENTQLLRRSGIPARPPDGRGPATDGTQLLRRPPARHRRRPGAAGEADLWAREPLLRDLDADGPARPAARASWNRDDAAPVDGPSHAGAPSEAKGTPRTRAMWTLADQVLSSGTNSILMFVVAREVSKVEFGAFSVAFLVFAVVIGFSKATGAQPLSIRYAGAPESVFVNAAARATGAALVLGVLAGACCALAGAALGGLTGSALLTLGLVLPGLLLQDQWRQVFFAQGRPAAAAANDGVWAVVQIIGVAMLLERHVALAAPMLLAWGAAAAVAALIGVAQAGFWPSPGRALDWVREHRDINGFLAMEYLTIQGALNASLLIIGAIGAVELVGALRGVQTLLGPTTILAVGLVSWAVPEFSRRKDMTAAERMRAAYLLSAAVTGVGLVWGLGFLFVGALRIGGQPIGRSLLGDTWPQTHHLLALSIVQQAGAAAAVGVSCMLIALGRAKDTFRLNVLAAPQLLVYPIVGVALGGGTGAVLGFTLANWVMLPFWIRMLRRAANDAEREWRRARRARSGRAPAGAGQRDGRTDQARQTTGRRGAPAAGKLGVE